MYMYIYICIYTYTLNMSKPMFQLGFRWLQHFLSRSICTGLRVPRYIEPKASEVLQLPHGIIIIIYQITTDDSFT